MDHWVNGAFSSNPEPTIGNPPPGTPFTDHATSTRNLAPDPRSVKNTWIHA